MLRNFRSLRPNVLASFGFVMILLAAKMPLFEWQTSEISRDFPSTYEVHSLTSPWTTRFGDSLSDGSYISSGRVYVTKNGTSCRREDLSFVVMRSQNDEKLERLSLSFIPKNSPWLLIWGVRVIILSGIYIWWFTIFYERRSILYAVLFTVIAGILYLQLTQVVRLLFPTVVDLKYLGSVACYHGTVIFNAIMSKVHYETILVFLAGILLELGAIGLMLRQIVKTVIERKRASIEK